MRRFALSLGALPLLLVLVIDARAADLTPVNLRPVVLRMGSFFPVGTEGLTVDVKDERPDPEVLYCSKVVNPMTGLSFSRHRIEGATPIVLSQVPKAMVTEAEEAVEMLGFKTGSDYVLEVTVRDIRIDVPLPTNLGSRWASSALIRNYVALASVDTVVKKADGSVVGSAKFRIASWTSGLRDMSGITHIHAGFIWEAVARTLLQQFPRDPDPAAVARLLAAFEASLTSTEKVDLLTWLGFVGKGSPAVAEKLVSIFRKERDQTIRENAALALAHLNTPEGREEILAVASGSNNKTEWDTKDAEESWHLTYAMHLMGIPDLKSKAPRSKRDPRRLIELFMFLRSGRAPTRSLEVEEWLEKRSAKSSAQGAPSQAPATPATPRP